MEFYVLDVVQLISVAKLLNSFPHEQRLLVTFVPVIFQARFQNKMTECASEVNVGDLF